jgi:hypothetical protein
MSRKPRTVASKRRTALSAAAPAAPAQPRRKDMDRHMRFEVALAAGSQGGLTIDAEAGTIRGVAVLSEGMARPANSFAFKVDQSTLQGAMAAINGAPAPLRVRITHPELEYRDGIDCTVGTIAGARIEGTVLRADVTIGSYAEHSPRGNMKAYLLALAGEAPHNMGMSVVIDQAYWDEDPADGQWLARIVSLFAVDFVGEPGGTFNGLLSRARDGTAAAAPAPTTQAAQGIEHMNRKQRALLKKWGLKDGVADAEIATFLSALDETKQAELAQAGTEGDEQPVADAAVQAAADGAAAGETAGEPGPLARGALARISAAEAARVSGLVELATIAGKDTAWLQKHVADRTSLSAARKAVAAERVQGNQPVGAGVSVGADNRVEAQRQSFRDAVALRAGVRIEKPHELSHRLRHLSIVDIGRHFLSALGVQDAMYMPKAQLWKLLQNRHALREYLTLGDYGGALGTFTGILGDTAGRSLVQGYGTYNRRWMKFANKFMAKDFRQIDRAGLGFTTLTATTRGHDISYAAVGDKREVYTLAKYTAGTAFAFEDFVNDDLNAIGTVPSGFGFIAAQQEDALAFAVLTANAALQDTYNLFDDTNHGNNTTTGTAISVASWTVARQKMMAQTEKGGNKPLNLAPNVLLCPSSKAHLARQVAFGAVDPASSGGALNPWLSDITDVIDSAELQAASATVWYAAVGAGRPGCSMEVALLEGEELPVVDVEEDFDSYTTKMRVRHCSAAAAIDYRGLQRNAGA